MGDASRLTLASTIIGSPAFEFGCASSEAVAHIFGYDSITGGHLHEWAALFASSDGDELAQALGALSISAAAAPLTAAAHAPAPAAAPAAPRVPRRRVLLAECSTVSISPSGSVTLAGDAVSRSPRVALLLSAAIAGNIELLPVSTLLSYAHGLGGQTDAVGLLLSLVLDADLKPPALVAALHTAGVAALQNQAATIAASVVMQSFFRDFAPAATAPVSVSTVAAGIAAACAAVALLPAVAAANSLDPTQGESRGAPETIVFILDNGAKILHCASLAGRPAADAALAAASFIIRSVHSVLASVHSALGLSAALDCGLSSTRGILGPNPFTFTPFGPISAPVVPPEAPPSAPHTPRPKPAAAAAAPAVAVAPAAAGGGGDPSARQVTSWSSIFFEPGHDLSKARISSIMKDPHLAICIRCWAMGRTDITGCPLPDPKPSHHGDNLKLRGPELLKPAHLTIALAAAQQPSFQAWATLKSFRPDFAQILQPLQ